MPISDLNKARLDDILSRELYEIPDTGPVVTLEPGQDISYAIENAPAGGIIVLKNGDHPAIGKVKHSAGVTVMAENKSGAKIQGTSGDTMSMNDGALIAHTLFRGLDMQAGGRSMLTTLSDTGSGYDVAFEDCSIDGGWNHDTNTGTDWGPYTGKWGLNPHRWAGYAARCDFKNIRREHGIYCHTPMNDILLYECRFMRNGRTGSQFVGRNGEAGFSPFQLDVISCFYDDNGLGDGGQSLTAGGMRYIHVQDSQFAIGRDRDFRARYMQNHPWENIYGEAHFVNWSDKGRQDLTDAVEFSGTNWFYNYPGDGAGTPVMVKNAKEFIASGNLHIIRSESKTAIELGTGMALSPAPDLRVDIKGKVVWV